MKKTYIIREQISTCKICRKKKDLRLGACFKCSDFVDGLNIGNGVHLLWDIRNKNNSWEVKL